MTGEVKIKKGRGGRRAGAGRKAGSRNQRQRTAAEDRASCAARLQSEELLVQFHAARNGDRVAAREIIALFRRAETVGLLPVEPRAGDLFATPGAAGGEPSL
jgi:hypothetical protein